jgi:F-type H+-transporting ATPase subunit delta
MQNPRLAARYAKSLIDLAVEQNSLDVALTDIKALHAACRDSRAFLLMLRNPIIPADKKQAIINAIFDGKLHTILKTFVELLIRKGREDCLLEICRSFMEQYNTLKKIKIVKLTTAVPIDEATQTAIMQKLTQTLAGYQVAVKTMVDHSIIGGFVLEADDKLIDASIRRDLNDIKKQFTGVNPYVRDIH